MGFLPRSRGLCGLGCPEGPLSKASSQVEWGQYRGEGLITVQGQAQGPVLVTGMLAGLVVAGAGQGVALWTPAPQAVVPCPVVVTMFSALSLT